MSDPLTPAERFRWCRRATTELPCFEQGHAPIAGDMGDECAFCGLLAVTVQAMQSDVQRPSRPPPEARDPNWRRAPNAEHGFAALNYEGGLIINSVRDQRDAVRLAAGECVPVPVTIAYGHR